MRRYIWDKLEGDYEHEEFNFVEFIEKLIFDNG